MAFFIKNYKINLHIRNSQTSTKLKPVFATDSQTHRFKKKKSQTHPQEREREKRNPSMDPLPVETQDLAATNDSHGCQNPDLDLTILRFYDLTCPKRSRSFKNLCNHSGSYDSDDPKRSWFFVIFFGLTEGSVGPKWKIKSQ